MLMITKRSGREEEFRPEKIQRSMRNAGVSLKLAQQIAGDICYREGMTTAQVRNRVIGAIGRHQPEVASVYETHPQKPHRS